MDEMYPVGGRFPKKRKPTMLYRYLTEIAELLGMENIDRFSGNEQLMGAITVELTRLKLLAAPSMTPEEADKAYDEAMPVEIPDEQLKKIVKNVLESDPKWLASQLKLWQQYASYCNCCAKSGESGPDDFDTFVKRMEKKDGTNPTDI